MIFTRLARKNGAASTFAMAIALATGAAIGVTALEAPAAAQKKPKYSKAFIAAYTPLQTALQAEALDAAAVKAAIPAVVAAIENEDDRYAAGGAIVGAGQKLNDLGLALQGLELMLASGKVAPEQLGQFNMQAGQIAYNQNQYEKARTYIRAAMEAGYTQNNPEGIIAESYFAENKYSEGLAYLSGVIDTRLAAGQTVDEDWIKRARAIAYNNDMPSEAAKYASLYVSQYPSPEAWADAVGIVLNTNNYKVPANNAEILDLMRLARRADAMADDLSYVRYVDAADYRSLPAEVVAVIDEGYAAGAIPRDDTTFATTRQQAADRAAADRADLEGILTRARAANAPLRGVMTAGDLALSLGRGAEAEEFYAKALTMPGVNTATALTRLGIAQVDQGKYAEADATFKRVEGARQAIANLWAAYVANKNGSM